MPQASDMETIVNALIKRSEPRVVIAIAGPPAVGKSTISEQLAAALDAHGGAVLVPMDGFHFDDGILIKRGIRHQKGAPHSFDFDGYAHLLSRIRTQQGHSLYAPRFDRDLEVSRGSAVEIKAETKFIVTEGNYLLLNQAPWTSLRPLFDATIWLHADEALLRARLEARWQDQSWEAERIKTHIEGNDLPNARLIIENAPQDPDFVIDAAK